MRFAEVSVNSPVAQLRAFSYAIPPGLSVGIGDAVWVPFGEKVLQGIVLELSPLPAVEETKEIIDVIAPTLDFTHVSLARWISEYYLSNLFDAVALMLPPGFERKAVTFIHLSSREGPEYDTPSLSEEQKKLLELVPPQGEIELKKLEKALGKKKTQITVSQLVKSGQLARSYRPEPVKVKPKKIPYLCLAIKPDDARQEAARLRQRRAAKQAELLEFLAGSPQPMPLSQVRSFTKTSTPVVRALASRGLVRIEQLEVKREPFSYDNVTLSYPLPLTADQKAALEAIRLSLLEKKPQTFLLHGVTGSGKTEIYLQALAEAVKLGKRGIVLVPEISLTPQTIERFAARFPHRVGILHSQLSLGEQFDEWHRIRKGEFDVVIGPRSAIFAPQPDLGLIIIDEEHEWTYKQEDKSPRYHARDVAVKLAELTGATVVMGSATPDVESFYHAQSGEYRLIELPQRVVPKEGASLPSVEIVDLKDELKSGNRSIFSRSLSEAITGAVSHTEQVILFLNRRGSATFVQCRRCGFVLRCKRCDIALTQHIDQNILTCHQCNYKQPVPTLCPRCSSRQMKYLGLGTQRLEQETSYSFPQAKRLRWDSDTTRQKHSHEEIFNRFRNHEADILIGTQMVAKGLDLPALTVVGVINADTGLYLPDFRAGEKTFQLLSQVAGRAGRGTSGGRVIIQTFSPEHYAIQAAARHDYASFYQKELDFRRQLHNPPFHRLALLIYTHPKNAVCQREAERMRDLLIQQRDAKGISDIDTLGPAPAYIHKLRGRFRWQLILRGSELSSFLSTILFGKGWSVDIDPVSIV